MKLCLCCGLTMGGPGRWDRRVSRWNPNICQECFSDECSALVSSVHDYAGNSAAASPCGGPSERPGSEQACPAENLAGADGQEGRRTNPRNETAPAN